PGELGSRLRWLGTSSGTIDDGDPRTETASIPIVPSDARPSDDSEGSGDSGTDAESEAADDAGPFGEAETEESTIDGDTDDGDTDNIDNSDNSASDAAPAPRQEDLSEADGIESDQVEASPSDAIVAKGSRWRTAAFIGALVLIVAAGLTAAATYFRDGWTVAASGQQIVMHKGRVSSVPLLNSSKAHVASDLTLKDLTESSRDKVLSGQHYNSESDARNFINNLQTTTTTASTTTTAPATTTSTIATTSTSPTATDSIVSNTTAPLDPTATTVPG
ncbi:MAG: hypothetical protein KDB26_12645, partial [Microthrixaceae bacterium]|nr:hypothetical protein [Microthrixaceae bacterium]